MQTLRTSSKSLEKQLHFQRSLKLDQSSTKNDHKQMKKPSTERKNPQDQDTQLRQIVKDYLRGKNIEQLKNKFYTERLVKKRNRASIDFRKSRDLRKSKNLDSEDKWKLTNHADPRHSEMLDHFQEHCQKMKQCTCGAHHIETNPIKFKVRDPVSKFQSNYTIDTKEVKLKSKSLNRKPEFTASYFSSQLDQVPQYSPKFDNINFGSSYKTQFLTLDQSQRVESFKHLKLSNVNFNSNPVKDFDTSYRKQFDKGNQNKYYSKTPQPFVVKQSQNLNAFGMKYHSIHSNYQKEFDEKRNEKRDALKPPSLFKDINFHLNKDSSYKQAFSPRTQQVKSSRKNRLNKEKIPIVHHLSSSFIPLDGITIDNELLNSSYKKDFVKEKLDMGKYVCPLGIKSSNGAISKY